MNIVILTLFPEMFTAVTSSILGKAGEKGILDIRLTNIRDYSMDKHKKADDYPFGGGAGMVLLADPVFRAMEAVKAEGKRSLYMSPRGRVLCAKKVRELAREKELGILCGHYEGVVERILDKIVTDHVCIGDYVLTGGELPAMIMIDAISRLVPGVLHNDVSAEFESFQDNLLEYPQYSRPEIWHDKQVPAILLSGHHANIEKWRREQSVIRTAKNRPDLIEKAKLTKEEQKLAKEIMLEATGQ